MNLYRTSLKKTGTQSCRHPGQSTQFSRWLREQPEIDSRIGYTTTDIDFVWRYKNKPEWMCIEEKRQCEIDENGRMWTRVTADQFQQFTNIHRLFQADDTYRGFYALMFSATSPDDGRAYLSPIESWKVGYRFNEHTGRDQRTVFVDTFTTLNRDDVIEFLKFNQFYL